MPTQQASLADPSHLESLSEDGKLLQVVIETPRGSRNKYAYNQEQRTFVLRKTLPAGMVFPYDFGFLPSTKADDGDPLDVLVLMEESAFPGCMVQARLIGVIEGDQTEEGETTRNDRLLAVSDTNHVYGEVKTLSELPAKLLEEIGEFFVNYHRLQGRKYCVLGHKGIREAQKLIEQSRKAA